MLYPKGIFNKSRSVHLLVVQGGIFMALREDLYNTARQIRVEEETAKSNVHKIFAEIYLK